MTETAATRPKGTRRRRILIVAIAAVLLFFLVRAGVDLWASSQIKAAESRLEQRYSSLDAATLTLPPIPEGQNRARPIRAAAALINYTPLTSWSEYQRSFSAFVRQHPPARMPADLRAFVETNRETLRVAADARSRPQSNWEADYASQSNMPRLLDIRTLSNTIYLTALLDLEAGRSDEAAQSVASGLALAASLRQEPWLVTQLIRMAVTVQPLEAVQRLLMQSEPSSASLEELAKWLAENRSPDPMTLGLLAELKYFNRDLRRLADGELLARGGTADLLPGPVARMMGARSSPYWLGPLARLSRPLVHLGRAHYLEQMEQLLEIQTGARPHAALPVVSKHWSPFKWLDSSTIPGLTRAMQSGELFIGQLGLAELAVALRRYRVERGQYPDALSVLVPSYVAVMPMDPVTGKPPEYERQDTGFRLRAQIGEFAAYNAPRLDWKVPK